MKKILYVMLSAIMLMSIGCRRATDNGAIDGNWRITAIEKLPSGENVEVDNQKFIAIQLELMQLYSYSSPSARITGVIDYDEDQEKLAVDFRSGVSASKLAMFGIYENPVLFTVEHASSKTLILRTESSRITCRKF